MYGVYATLVNSSLQDKSQLIQRSQAMQGRSIHGRSSWCVWSHDYA